MSSFQIVNIALLVYKSEFLRNYSSLSCIFWVFTILTQILYFFVALKDPGFWPIRAPGQPPNSTFIVLVEEHPLADQENIPTVKDESTPSNSQNLNENPVANLNSSTNLNKNEHFSSKNTRFCSNCLINQVLRTRHCRDCGRCVSLYDHHCPWVGNCIGQNNRLYFFWYIFAQCCEIWIAGYTCVLTFEGGTDIKNWIWNNWLSVLILMILGLFGIMVTFLLFFHCYLALKNFTTWEFLSWNKIEYLRDHKKKISPFSQGYIRNLKEYCCERFPPFKQWELKF